MSKAIVVSLYGGPGAGKSTMAAGLFAELKWRGINCEIVTEFAKDKVWEESFKVLESQLYVFGKQYHKLRRLEDKVDVIITDAPLLNSIVYNKEFGPTFDQLVLETFYKFQNMNYHIKREKEYNPKGRTQTFEEAKEIDDVTSNLLDKYYIGRTVVRGNKDSINTIADQVVDKLKAMSEGESFQEKIIYA